MKEVYQPGHLPVRNQLGYIAASKLLFDPYLNRRGIKVRGLENLPGGSAPYILAANHRSLLDVPVLGQILLEHDGTQLHFVAKKELWKYKLLGKYLDSTDVIKYDRDLKMSNQPEVVDRMNSVLQNEGVLAMFPEHTRKHGRELQITKRGLGMLAVANLVPIVSVGLHGTDSLRGPIHVNIAKATPVGLVGPDSRRRRIVEMEYEYTAALQDAINQAYEMAGATIAKPDL